MFKLKNCTEMHEIYFDFPRKADVDMKKGV